jgi:Gas vesicle protein G
MLLDILTFPLLGPIKGVAWIGEQILERADFQQNDRESLEKQLLALQLSFDLGDISEEDFETQEEEILLALQALETEDDR